MLFLLYKLDKYTTGFVTEIAVFSYFDTKIVVMQSVKDRYHFVVTLIKLKLH